MKSELKFRSVYSFAVVICYLDWALRQCAADGGRPSKKNPLANGLVLQLKYPLQWRLVATGILLFSYDSQQSYQSVHQDLAEH